MKIILFLIFITNSIILNAQWVKMHKFNSSAIEIHFPTDNIGYAYLHKGLTGTVHSYSYMLAKTVDSGYNWEIIWSDILSEDMAEDYVNYMFLSPTIAFRNHRLENGLIQRTIDGGVSWEGLYEICKDCSYYPINESVICYITTSWDNNYSYLVKSNLVNSDTILISDNIFYKEIIFTNDSTGYISYKTFNDTNNIWGLLKTTDYGETWSLMVQDSVFEFTKLYFPTEDVGYVTTHSNVLIKTNNAGINWEYININTDEKLNSFAFLNENIGYAVGNNGLIMKTENGIDWNPDLSPTCNNLVKVLLPSEKIGYILTEDNAVLKKNLVPKNDSELIFRTYPNPSGDFVNVEVEMFDEAIIEVYNSMGCLVESIYPYSVSFQLDIYGYRDGLYYVKYRHGNFSKINKVLKISSAL